jgi:hypothetical protein
MKRPVTRYSTNKELVPLQDKKPTMRLTPSIHDAIPSTTRMHQVSVHWHPKDPLDRTDMSRHTRNFDLMASISRIRGGPGRVVHRDITGRYLSQQRRRIRQQ